MAMQLLCYVGFSNRDISFVSLYGGDDMMVGVQVTVVELQRFHPLSPTVRRTSPTSHEKWFKVRMPEM